MLLPFESLAQEPTREFTTFETYAKMTKHEQSKITGYVFGMILRQAYAQKDEERLKCLDANFLKSKGDPEVVDRHYGLMKGNIAVVSKNHTPTGRVEYLLANYMIDVCPRSKK